MKITMEQIRDMERILRKVHLEIDYSHVMLTDEVKQRCEDEIAIGDGIDAHEYCDRMKEIALEEHIKTVTSEPSESSIEFSLIIH